MGIRLSYTFTHCQYSQHAPCLTPALYRTWIQKLLEHACHKDMHARFIGCRCAQLSLSNRLVTCPWWTPPLVPQHLGWGPAEIWEWMNYTREHQLILWNLCLVGSSFWWLPELFDPGVFHVNFLWNILKNKHLNTTASWVIFLLRYPAFVPFLFMLSPYR